MVIVDKKRGVIHKSAFGNQSENSVVLLASTSKVPTVTLLMALYEDADGVSSVGLISQLIAIIDEALDKVR